MHWSSFLCNCNAFGSLEGIHLAKRNRTDMRYSYCRDFPMTINPDMCPTLLSKVSLDSSLCHIQIFRDLHCSHLLNDKILTRCLESDLLFEFVGRWVVILMRLMIPTVKSCLLLAVTGKRLLYVCIGSLLCLDADIL